jgi:hypothetical protein
MSRRWFPHVRVRSKRQKTVALVACIASLVVVLPGQALAQKYTPRGSVTAFSVFTMDDAPHALGRWNPCAPIGYRVNRTQASRGAVADVKRAIHRVSKATGLTFIYRGRTNRIPQARWSKHAYPADTQLIVAWIRPSQSTLWPRGSASTVAGRSGAWHLMAKDRAGRRWGRYDRGFVLLNARMRFPAGFRAIGPSGSRGRELMHELGHVVGLNHPTTGGRQQIMYPLLTRKPAHWGRGDLAGLRIVGSSGGCLKDVT